MNKTRTTNYIRVIPEVDKDYILDQYDLSSSEGLDALAEDYPYFVIFDATKFSGEDIYDIKFYHTETTAHKRANKYARENLDQGSLFFEKISPNIAFISDLIIHEYLSKETAENYEAILELIIDTADCYAFSGNGWLDDHD